MTTSIVDINGVMAIKPVNLGAGSGDRIAGPSHSPPPRRAPSSSPPAKTATQLTLRIGVSRDAR